MNDISLLTMPVGDTVFCMGRALVLGILVSSEALLARNMRVGFKRHLILFSTSAFLMCAEVLGVTVGLWGDSFAWLTAGVWVWYPVLRTVGVLGIAFCFDYVRALHQPDGRAERMIRRSSQCFLLSSGLILALGALLMDAPFRQGGPPTSVYSIGRAAFLLHGVQAGAMALLAWNALRARRAWLTVTERRVFLMACAGGLVGAIAQIWLGPREHLTTVAFTLFVAVFLRDNYRRSQMEAFRAAEERAARMLLFHRITTRLKSTTDLGHLYEILMDSLMGNLGAESGAVYAADLHERALRPVLVQGPYPTPLPPKDGPPAPAPGAPAPVEARPLRPGEEYPPVQPGEGVVGRVAQGGVPLYLYDRRGGRRHYPWTPDAVHTTIALPLATPEGNFGVVQVVNRLNGTAFDEEDLRFMSLVVEQASLAIYNARLHEEILERQRSEEQLRVARQIQLRLIPTDLPRIPGLSLGVEYHPAQEVGGDYFDFYRIDHDHLGVLVFDVAGKGVPGALLMATTGTFLKMAAPRSTNPAWVLNEVNAALSAEIRRGLYVTALYGVLRLSTLQLTLVNAGHLDAIIVRERDMVCEKHKPRGVAIGLVRPNRFRAIMEQETVQLEQGDTLLLYTDGVTEAMNEQGEQFGEERLFDVCRSTAREGPRRLAADIVDAVRRHSGESRQYDDITVVALRIWPEPEDQAGTAAP